MKKNLSVIFLVLILLICFVSCGRTSKELTVYAYDSFCSSWGPGNEIVKAFTEKTGINVNLVSCAGAPELYSKVAFEGDDCPADVVIGLSDSMNIDTSLFLDWEPQCNASLIDHVDNGLIPFDYGYFSFIYDTESTIPAPTCLDDLLKDTYKGKFILIDPRTSSVGLGLYLWTVEVYGIDGALSWWKQAVDNALTVASSWSSAYGLFTEGEAPLVISYTTSPVYHLFYEDSTRFKALDFKDGHIGTTEYLAVSKNSKQEKNARLFCEFVLTEGQSSIALSNTMFPANKETALPDAFSAALEPSLILKTNLTSFTNEQDNYIKQWSEAMAN